MPNKTLELGRLEQDEKFSESFTTRHNKKTFRWVFG